jgi:hypothetical protein
VWTPDAGAQLRVPDMAAARGPGVKPVDMHGWRGLYFAVVPLPWSLTRSRASDGAWIAELRADVMRADLERLGRYDQVRVREHFTQAFRPEHTYVIEVAGPRQVRSRFGPNPTASGSSTSACRPTCTATASAAPSWPTSCRSTATRGPTGSMSYAEAAPLASTSAQDSRWTPQAPSRLTIRGGSKWVGSLS